MKSEEKLDMLQERSVRMAINTMSMTVLTVSIIVVMVIATIVGYTSIHTRIDDLSATMNARFEAIDDKFERRFESMNRRFDELLRVLAANGELPASPPQVSLR